MYSITALIANIQIAVKIVQGIYAIHDILVASNISHMEYIHLYF